ncbi:hypothetical protein [Providencia stuartii]|uniref:hypothetical protein n=1 Tax=Providencia stuartii TaxID=588 RepID=UPI0023B1E514|nr:hypothetical protein [Providencia thailandensis]MDE8748237.1 hypothetical protein [Providencia thailandensis]MDE8767612.1 hypothetical protein [Providencia thailandensis]MDE8779981.1 hypothetical protein [Providencia thailandensis]MDE8783939.1 hypothetical protein [Providencia thailandensis]MDE8788043.1 hypothetical protein [Providencia thailandensis]
MHKIKFTAHKFEVIFFIVIYTFYCVKSGLFSLAINESIFLELKDILNILLISLLLIIVFFLQDTKNKLFLLFFVFLTIVNILFFNNKSYFGYLFLVSLTMYSTRLKWSTLIKIIITSNIFTIILVLIMAPFSDYYFMIDERFGERFTAGLDNPNTLGQYSFMIFSLIALYLETKKINSGLNALIITSIFLITIFILYLTFSRTSLYLCLMFYTLYLFKFIKKDHSELKNRMKLKKALILFSLFLIMLQFFFIIYFKDIPFLFIINEVLTSRLWFGNILYNSLGFPPVFHGANIGSYLPIDFYFIQTIYNLGIIPFAILYYLTIKKLLKTKISLLMFFTLFIMLLETMTETYFSVPFYSISLFIIFSKKGKNEQ